MTRRDNIVDKQRSTPNVQALYLADHRGASHSHSIVAGGLLEMS